MASYRELAWAVRASTPTSTTWSFELPEDLAPIKRSTLRAQLSSAVNRHHTSWASAVDIHGLPGGDRPTDGALRPCARSNRDQIRPRDHENDFCMLAAREMLFAIELFADLGLDIPAPAALYSDSKSAVDLAFDPVAFKKTKHILRAAEYHRAS